MLTLIYHPSFHIKQSEGAQIQTTWLASIQTKNTKIHAPFCDCAPVYGEIYMDESQVLLLNENHFKTVSKLVLKIFCSEI